METKLVELGRRGDVKEFRALTVKGWHRCKEEYYLRRIFEGYYQAGIHRPEFIDHWLSQDTYKDAEFIINGEVRYEAFRAVQENGGKSKCYHQEILDYLFGRGYISRQDMLLHAVRGGTKQDVERWLDDFSQLKRYNLSEVEPCLSGFLNEECLRIIIEKGERKNPCYFFLRKIIRETNSAGRILARHRGLIFITDRDDWVANAEHRAIIEKCNDEIWDTVEKES